MGLQRKLYFENVRVGEELPPLLQPALDRIAFARYAAATDDFNRLHLDEDYARRSGFPSVCAPGMLAMGFLAQLAADWLRPGQVRRISARFVKILWPGDQLVCRGRVVDKRREGAEFYVDLELWGENQKGELVIKGSACTRVFQGPEDEDRQRRGLPPEPVGLDDRPSLVDVLERELPRVEAAPARGGRKKAADETIPAPPPRRAASRSTGTKARK